MAAWVVLIVCSVAECWECLGKESLLVCIAVHLVLRVFAVQLVYPLWLEDYRLGCPVDSCRVHWLLRLFSWVGYFLMGFGGFYNLFTPDLVVCF